MNLIVVIFSVTLILDAAIINAFLPYIFTKKIIFEPTKKEKILSFAIGLLSVLNTSLAFYFGFIIMLFLGGDILGMYVGAIKDLLINAFILFFSKPLIEIIFWFFITRFNWSAEKWQKLLKIVFVFNLFLLFALLMIRQRLFTY